MNTQGSDRKSGADDDRRHVPFDDGIDTLFQIGMAITSGLTMKQVLQSILDECRRALPVDTLYVALYDAAADSYEIPLLFDVGEYHAVERVYRQDTRSLTSDVIAMRRTLYIPDIRDPASMAAHIAIQIASAPTVSYLGVPMVVRERVVGVLSIQSMQADAYSLAVIRFLETIAMQAAVAVENARLYEAAQTELIERRRVHERLRFSEQRYRTLADNVRDAIWVRDLEGNLTYISPSIPHLWGYSRDDFARRSPEGVALSPQAMAATRERTERMLRAVRENQPIPAERFDLPMRRKDGAKILMDVLQSPLVDEEGNISGFLFVGRDVTEARAMAAEICSLNTTLEQRVAQRTAELSAALDQLQLADRMKDEFLAAMSHELRTPLTGILGAAEALAMEERGTLNDQQKRQVQIVAESGERLLKMVNDLLHYANLAAGKTTILYERCSLAVVGDASFRKANLSATRKQQQITFHITPPELVITSDAEAIMHILDALLDNAVKFTPVDGHIALEIGLNGDDTVRLVVTDDGIGITPEKQELIFQPFVQGDGALSRAYEGTGLGLAYVARMTTALGGGVEVESELGRGSRFTITLPIRP